VTHQPSAITVTLHWQGDAGARSATIICEDSPPRALLPLLAAGCGLPERTPQGRPIVYAIRLGAAGGRVLSQEWPIGAQGVCDGSHLWLGPARPDATGPRHCALALPQGGAVLIPLAGLVLTRRRLLGALELLHPEAHARELRLLDEGGSAYRYVSNRPHCALSPDGPGAWHVATDREDVTTLLNGAPLSAARPSPLADGNALQLGDGGPTLTIALV
jgi:hypothetical protein